MNFPNIIHQRKTITDKILHSNDDTLFLDYQNIFIPFLFKFNCMKNINRFDFPSNSTQSCKNTHYEQHSDSKDKALSSKLRYKENLQFHMEKQRNLVKENQKNKQIQESQKKKKQLQSELEKKKKQLLELEALRQRAQQNQKKSFELALQKQEQDRLKKQQNMLRKQRFDENAVNRFGEALKKLHEEKQTIAFKQKLAQQRRKTAQEFQKIDRAKANQYKNEIEEREKKQRVEKEDELQIYQRTIKTFYSDPNPDYNRSCLHNLKIVHEKKEQQKNAFDQGSLQMENLREKQQQKARRLFEMNQRSRQRGKQALLKIQRERELEQFQKESLEEQKQYNMQRIQAGKKNQFVGVKPSTLSQMQQNKQQRSQEQFDKMFFPNRLNENYSKPASKYEIVENKIPSHHAIKSHSLSQTKKLSKTKPKQESQHLNVSQGKHSFEQPQYSEFQSQSKAGSRYRKQDEHVEEEEYQNEEQQQHHHLPEQQYLKNELRQTRAPDERQRFNKIEHKGLSSAQRQVPIKNKQKQQKERPLSSKKQQFTTFDADKLLEKYGLKNQIFHNGSKGSTSAGNGMKEKQDSKRKVVELGNICENRKVEKEKEQLSYSQSDEDSLN